MKLNSKSKIILLITLGTLFASSSIITNFNIGNINNGMTYNLDFTFDNENVKLSEISGPIYIDDTDPTKNWLITNATYDWCSGSGLINDPYIIENVTINALSYPHGIFIENSNVHFMIRNCVVYNAYSRGIRLNRVDHGILYNNTSSQNDNGIFINRCNFINVTNNYIIDNAHNGIELSAFCSSCTVSDNVIINNDQNGIVLRQENLFCNITNNTVIGHRYSGIHIQGGSNYNNILFNTVKDNPGDGISIYHSNHNNISANKLYNNKQFGIVIREENSNNIISQNTMIGCGIGFSRGTITTITSNIIDNTNLVNGKMILYYINEVSLTSDDFINPGQVILLNCINSLISNLNVSNGGGISLYFCENIEVTRNTVDFNYRGISLDRSDNNTISTNFANNSRYGIYLWGSDNNAISENIAINNEYGIYLQSCINNTISENYADNNEYGISAFYESSINMISGNTANYNDYGISLFMSDYNIVSGNYLIGNNVCINENYCEGNVFINNNCGRETVISGYNVFFLLGILSVVAIIIYTKKRNLEK